MKYRFSSLVDMKKIQELLQMFADLLGVAVALLDVEGSVLAQANWQPLCKDFHRNNTACNKLCRQSDEELISLSVKKEGLHIHECGNGLIDSAVPVIIQGEHLATLFAGQFFLTAPDKETFRLRARKYNFDEDEYLCALAKTPIIRDEHLQLITGFLKLLASLLAEIGLEKLQERRVIKQRLLQTSQALGPLGEHSSVMVWSTDKDLRCTFYTDNKVALSPIADRGNKITEHFSTGKASDLIMSAHRRALTGELVNLETELAGQLWDIYIQPVKDEDNNIIGTLGVAYDIGEQRKVNQVLLTSEKLYRELYDNATDIMFTADLDGRFTSFNRALGLYLGYSSQELKSYTLYDLVPAKHHDFLSHKIDEKLAGADITSYELEVYTRQGNKLILDIRSKLIYDHGEPVGIQGIGRDVTEQKRIQNALAASEQKFRTLAEDTTAIIYILQNRHFTYVNPAFVKLTAFTQEELLAMDFLNIVHPEHREMVWERVRAIHEGVTPPDRYEIKLINKFGSIIWLYLTGSRIIYEDEPALLASALDITELKHWEEALRESQALLNNIFDFLPDPTMVIDRQGQLLAWNRAMEAMTGIPAVQVLGQGNYEHALPFYGSRRPMLIDLVMEPENISWYYPDIQQINNQLTVELYVPSFGHHGAYLWGIATPLYNARGEITGAIESIRDITDRKHMEIELTSQTESLALVLENSPAGTAIMNEDGQLVFLNSRAVEIIGYTREDIPTMDMWMLKAYPNEYSRQTMMRRWEQSLNYSGRAQGHAHVRCKDGQFKDLEFHGTKLPDRRIIISMWDMTWQKQVEEQLRAGEARFKALSDASFEGIMLSENNICIDANQKAAQMFGYPLHEIIGQDLLNFITPDSVNTVEAHMASDYELPYEATGMRKDGTRIPIEIQGRMFQYQGRKVRASAIRDLSERKQAQAKIYRHSQNLQALFYNTPDAVVLCDPQERIVSINPQFTDLFGFNLEECRRRTLEELIVPEGLKAEYSNHAAAGAMGESILTETLRRHKNGKLFDVMVKTVPIANFGFYVIYSDISARKLAEKTIKKQLQELEAQNAEMERFTYTVSHDLRSPLITIKGFAGFLLNDIQKGHYEHLENDLRRIINAAGKMDDLLRDLLELSRIGRLLNPPTRFSMTQLAMEVVELLAGRLQETGIQITVDPDMPEVIADKARIREVVQNLVENAVKFRGQHNKPVIAIGCQNAPHAPTFFVRDNGIGIEPRYYDSIFGLFNKLDPGCEGTGIGLSLVKRIVELHNGKIWVESAGTGKGSTFYFTIPGEAISK